MKSIKGLGIMRDFHDTEDFEAGAMTEYSITFSFFGHYKNKEAIRSWIDELHDFLVKGEEND